MKTKFFALLMAVVFVFTGCGVQSNSENGGSDFQGNNLNSNKNDINSNFAELGDDNKTFGDAIEDTGAYEGYFEEDLKDVVVKCISGTQNAYELNGNTLTFTKVNKETVYSISGKFKGNIVIDVGDDYKFDLELHGLSIVSGSVNPILIKSGDEVAIKAKKDTKNYIYDMRNAVDSNDETLYSGAIHSEVDLEIGGKGELTVVSENNNGIHSKDDVQVKNLTLLVACIDNAIKGNDSVEIESGNTVLIASGGDCIKTSNSNVSDKGNQRGSITIAGGTHTLFAARDGIDASYNVVINNSATELNIYTDKYSNYSNEVTETTSEINYIRFTNNKYFYSVKFYNSDTDYVWVNAEYHSKSSVGRTNYYYYTYPQKSNYKKIQFFVYESETQQEQEEKCLFKSPYLTPNDEFDTFALSETFGGFNYQWTNFSTKAQEGGFGRGPGGFGGGFGGPGGMGGFGGGNTDKGDYSTKGIKAANEIIVNAGIINIKSYDDAIHANNDTEMENGKTPLGNVTVNGGTITVYSNDDGLHADGTLYIKSGAVKVTNAYEGFEGTKVDISGGVVSINSKDDGINATSSSGAAIAISGGEIYIYCTGDGIDSNSRTAREGIVFSGGKTVVISNSNMNSAIDNESGYSYEGGTVVAVMPRGGMSSESTKCDNFSKVGTKSQISLKKGEILVVEFKTETVSVDIPVDLNALIIALGDNTATIKTESGNSGTSDENKSFADLPSNVL